MVGALPIVNEHNCHCSRLCGPEGGGTIFTMWGSDEQQRLCNRRIQTFEMTDGHRPSGILERDHFSISRGFYGQEGPKPEPVWAQAFCVPASQSTEHILPTPILMDSIL